jgi:predicted MFS family arabinose efflux permease
MAVVGIGIGSSFLVAMVVGPLLAARFGVPALFWIAAGLTVVAALLLQLLPDIARPETRTSWNIVPAFRGDLLRVDFYMFLLHAIMTATFVALPFLLRDRLGIPMTGHWKMYVGALVLSFAIAIPLIMADRHQGRSRLIAVAVTLIFVAQLGLAFFSVATLPVFLALVLYFAGFNFLEAGLPARLSVLADEAVRGASLGVFSSAQFFGAFVGGLLGGRFHGPGRPTDVFFVCALLAAIWLAAQGFGRFRAENPAGN